MLRNFCRKPRPKTIVAPNVAAALNDVLAENIPRQTVTVVLTNFQAKIAETGLARHVVCGFLRGRDPDFNRHILPQFMG